MSHLQLPNQADFCQVFTFKSGQFSTVFVNCTKRGREAKLTDDNEARPGNAREDQGARKKDQDEKVPPQGMRSLNVGCREELAQ